MLRQVSVSYNIRIRLAFGVMTLGFYDPVVLIACSSTQSAGASVPAMRLVRITHPFHPLSGREVACVGERYNRYGRRLLLRVDDVTVCSVPPQWTDLVAPDPEIVIGEYRALFRVADLLELERLVDQLRKRVSGKKPDDA